MARRRTTAADTTAHDTVTGQPPSAPGAPSPVNPGAFGHPDAVYCPDCGRTAIGRMAHGPHEKKKS